MLSEDPTKHVRKQPYHVCHTPAFCHPLFPAVLLRKLTINSNIPQKLTTSDRGRGSMVVKKQIRTPKAKVKRTTKMCNWFR